MPTFEFESRGVYVISVAAELAGVHPQTLRIYERKGLLEPSRTGGGSRRYSERDIARLRRILAAFHRATVRDLLTMEHAAARNEWQEVRRLADRIAIGCAQIGEGAAADCLAPLRDVHHEVTARAMFFAWYAPRRDALLALLDRAAECASSGSAAHPLRPTAISSIVTGPSGEHTTA